MMFHYSAKIFTPTCTYQADGFFHSDKEFIEAISSDIHEVYTVILRKEEVFPYWE